MSSHRMTRYGDAGRVEFWKGGEERLGKFASYVGFHFVVCGPGRGGCIDVETSATAKVVGVIFTCYLEPSCIQWLAVSLAMGLCVCRGAYWEKYQDIRLQFPSLRQQIERTPSRRNYLRYKLGRIKRRERALWKVWLEVGGRCLQPFGIWW